MPTRSLVPTFGLAAFALAIGAACLSRRVFPSVPNVLVFAPAVLCCLAAAYWYGLRTSQSVRPSRRLARGVLWVVATGVILILPSGLLWARLKISINSIPVPANASRVHREMNIGLWEQKNWLYHVRYITQHSFDEANTLIKEGFVANGWELDRSPPERQFSKTENVIIATAPEFGSPAIDGRVQVYVFAKSRHEHVLVWLFDVGTERWFECGWMR